MIAPLARFIDWSALQVWVTRIPHAEGRNPRLEEALQFLKGPDFTPAESQPARVEFTGPLHFRFPTPRPCDLAENNTVYGRLYRCSRRWQERPVIVLLHGARDFVDHWLRFPLIARRCNRAGFNVATLVAPYHFQRRPRQQEALKSPGYLRWAEGAAQGVAEIRALTGWLLGQGCPAVALWGISMGGWLAGLTACRDARLASVVLAVPAVRANLAFADRVIWPRIRETLRGRLVTVEPLNLSPSNLTTARPAIPRENILLIEAIHDLFVGKEPIEDLWQAWEQPEIWRLPHGHVSFMGQPGLTGRVLRWLAPRLEKPAMQTAQTVTPRPREV